MEDKSCACPHLCALSPLVHVHSALPPVRRLLALQHLKESAMCIFREKEWRSRGRDLPGALGSILGTRSCLPGREKVHERLLRGGHRASLPTTSVDSQARGPPLSPPPSVASEAWRGNVCPRPCGQKRPPGPCTQYPSSPGQGGPLAWPVTRFGAQSPRPPLLPTVVSELLGGSVCLWLRVPAIGATLCPNVTRHCRGWRQRLRGCCLSPKCQRVLAARG